MFTMIIVPFCLSFASSTDENMKKWPQTETRSQIGAFTLSRIFFSRKHSKKKISVHFVYSSILYKVIN